MQNYWRDILTNVIANLISDLVLWLIILFIGFSLIKEIIHYGHLRRFFGLTGKQDDLLIYLSSLPVAKDGLINRYGYKHSFDQLTLAAVEVAIIPWLSILFASDPLQKLPRKIQSFFSRYWAFRLVQLEHRPSPLLEEQIEHVPMLIIGGPYFNSAAKYYQENGTSHLRFNPIIDYEDKSEWISVEVTKGESKGTVFTTSETYDLGLLERFTDDRTGATIVLVAGARTNGTKAAVHYLVHHWKDLRDKFGVKDFAICLRCYGRSIDPNAYKNASVLFEWTRTV